MVYTNNKKYIADYKINQTKFDEGIIYTENDVSAYDMAISHANLLAKQYPIDPSTQKTIVELTDLFEMDDKNNKRDVKFDKTESIVELAETEKGFSKIEQDLAENHWDD